MFIGRRDEAAARRCLRQRTASAGRSRMRCRPARGGARCAAGAGQLLAARLAPGLVGRRRLHPVALQDLQLRPQVGLVFSNGVVAIWRCAAFMRSVRAPNFQASMRANLNVMRSILASLNLISASRHSTSACCSPICRSCVANWASMRAAKIAIASGLRALRSSGRSERRSTIEHGARGDPVRAVESVDGAKAIDGHGGSSAPENGVRR